MNGSKDIGGSIFYGVLYVFRASVVVEVSCVSTSIYYVYLDDFGVGRIMHASCLEDSYIPAVNPIICIAQEMVMLILLNA